MKLDSVIGFSKQITVFGNDPNLPMSETLMGVEVELEGVMPSMDTFSNLTHWETVNDGSLRNGGMEFIFQQPIYGTGIRAALDELQIIINERRPVVSPRCSIHVHMNVSDLSVEQLYKLINLYILVERPLMRYHGHGREDNIFCVPFYKAPAQLQNITDFNTTEDSRHVKDDLLSFNKYYALNIGAVAQHGSLEFRHMAGTTDMDKIYEWIQMIQHLKAFALGENYSTTQDILDNLSGDSGLLLRNIFGDELGSKLSYPGSGGDVVKGGRIVQEVMHNKILTYNTDVLGSKRKSAKVSKKIASLYNDGKEVVTEKKKAVKKPSTGEDGVSIRGEDAGTVAVREAIDRYRRRTAEQVVPAAPEPVPVSTEDLVQWANTGAPVFRYSYDTETRTVTREETENSVPQHEARLRANEELIQSGGTE